MSQIYEEPAQEALSFAAEEMPQLFDEAWRRLREDYGKMSRHIGGIALESLLTRYVGERLEEKGVPFSREVHGKRLRGDTDELPEDYQGVLLAVSNSRNKKHPLRRPYTKGVVRDIFIIANKYPDEPLSDQDMVVDLSGRHLVFAERQDLLAYRPMCGAEVDTVIVPHSMALYKPLYSTCSRHIGDHTGLLVGSTARWQQSKETGSRYARKFRARLAARERPPGHGGFSKDPSLWTG